mgnify:FL=1
MKDGWIDVGLVVPPMASPRYLVHRHTLQFQGTVQLILILGGLSLTPTTILEAVSKELPTVLLTMIKNNLPYREITMNRTGFPRENYFETKPVPKEKIVTKEEPAKPKDNKQTDKLKLPLIALVLCVIIYVGLKML